MLWAKTPDRRLVVIFVFPNTGLAQPGEDGGTGVGGVQSGPWGAMLMPPLEVLVADPVGDSDSRNRSIC